MARESKPGGAGEAFDRWARGTGPIEHREETRARVRDLAQALHRRGLVPAPDFTFEVLAAADRLCSAAMWLVVHMTYARAVRLDGGPLAAGDFKPDPQGHTGGSLNMVPAYVGYLAANTLTATTRSWLMGQGHCVAAIDAVNLLVGNLTEAHARRYAIDDAGLTRFVRDFYAYALRPDGLPDSPLGSHVGPYTAGGMMEGGYLGFAELQYAHMPLPGERLVTFLSDGAFEEQRGSDWVPRWWRAEDCGWIAPFMIANGRRIDQRSSLAMKGGVEWFREHLRLNGFEPLRIDGRDPADFAWGIVTMEDALARAAEAVRAGEATYPVPIPYGIAETVKGHGFPGAGTNRAHNLPLEGNPAEDARARESFNAGARALWIDPDAIKAAARSLNRHVEQGRPKERDHPLAHRDVTTPSLPEPPWREPGGPPARPMAAIDEYFTDVVAANPELRVRVGNPDEMRSNRLDRTLDTLRHRVTHPEPGVAEAVDGRVITALNEEAVVSAALGNRGGLNLVATYEAFAPKMLGALRQALVFARRQHEAGEPPRWLSLPVVATSHTWENGKNEQSHQDTSFAEALMGEMSDVARVAFAADWNSAVALLRGVYTDHGRIWCLVVPKRPLPPRLTDEQAEALLRDGAVRLRGTGAGDERLLLAATGAYQLGEALRASDRLAAAGLRHALVYLQEPGRFRAARDGREATALAAEEVIADLFPPSAESRVFLTHTRPEPYLGTLWPLTTGQAHTRALGYRNRGGTLDVAGMLFANRCSWAHALVAAAAAAGRSPEGLLDAAELAAVTGQGDPAAVTAAG